MGLNPTVRSCGENSPSVHLSITDVTACRPQLHICCGPLLYTSSGPRYDFPSIACSIRESALWGTKWTKTTIRPHHYRWNWQRVKFAGRRQTETRLTWGTSRENSSPPINSGFSSSWRGCKVARKRLCSLKRVFRLNDRAVGTRFLRGWAYFTLVKGTPVWRAWAACCEMRPHQTVSRGSSVGKPSKRLGAHTSSQSLPLRRRARVRASSARHW